MTLKEFLKAFEDVKSLERVAIKDFSKYYPRGAIVKNDRKQRIEFVNGFNSDGSFYVVAWITYVAVAQGNRFVQNYDEFLTRLILRGVQV